MDKVSIMDTAIPLEKSTYWLRPDGQVATHRVWFDETGAQCGESGDPAPPGTELDSEGVARAMRAQSKSVRDADAAYQVEAKAAVEVAVAEREKRAKELTDAGLPEVAAEAIVGPVPIYRSPSSAPDPASADGLRGFDLSNEQINRIIGGWI